MIIELYGFNKIIKNGGVFGTDLYCGIGTITCDDGYIINIHKNSTVGCDKCGLSCKVEDNKIYVLYKNKVKGE